ncbi:MAG: hypothetical protein QM661_00175 [Solimonas sp.]
MAKLGYLLDLPVVAELTRPNGNRRIFTLFQQRQALCAIAAPASYALQRGVELMHDSERSTQLRAFVTELLRSGPPVLPFDGDAASWLARVDSERIRRNWSSHDGQLAAIAATRELTLVTRNASPFAGLGDLRAEDWFRP